MTVGVYSKQNSDGGPSGTILGQSTTDLVGFHGTAGTAVMALITNTSGTLGNTNTAVSAIITALVAKGLMSAT